VFRPAEENVTLSPSKLVTSKQKSAKCEIYNFFIFIQYSINLFIIIMLLKAQYLLFLNSFFFRSEKISFITFLKQNSDITKINLIL
jgi:hypothetical protein